MIFDHKTISIHKFVGKRIQRIPRTIGFIVENEFTVPMLKQDSKLDSSAKQQVFCDSYPKLELKLNCDNYKIATKRHANKEKVSSFTD